MKNLYLNFLRIASSIYPNKNKKDVLDCTAIELLNKIAVQHSFDKPLTVTEAMALTEIASPATIHRKLNGLLDADLIELVFKEKNRRTKYIHPTKSSFFYFEKMADAMVEVCRN